MCITLSLDLWEKRRALYSICARVVVWLCLLLSAADDVRVYKERERERESVLLSLCVIFLGKKVSAHSILFSLKSISRLKWSHKGNFFSKRRSREEEERSVL